MLQPGGVTDKTDLRRNAGASRDAMNLCEAVSTGNVMEYETVSPKKSISVSIQGVRRLYADGSPYPRTALSLLFDEMRGTTGI